MTKSNKYRIRNFLSVAISLGTLFCLIFSPTSLAKQQSITPMTHDEMSKQAIKDQVKVLRQVRYEQMPYLDRSFIRRAVNSDRVRERSEFIAAKERTLAELIDRAIEVHTPVKAAWERISLAKRRIFVALRELFPEIKFEYKHRDGSLSAGPFNSQKTRYTFRQPIFRGGVLWNTMLQERADMKAAQKEYDQVIADVINDVSQSYFEYERALLTAQDQQKMIEKMERFANFSKQKWQEGLISEIEYLNVDSIFSQMKFDYETSIQELELAELELQKYLGLSMDDEVTLEMLYDLDIMLENEKARQDRGGKGGGHQFRLLPQQKMNLPCILQ